MNVLTEVFISGWKKKKTVSGYLPGNNRPNLQRIGDSNWHCPFQIETVPVLSHSMVRRVRITTMKTYYKWITLKRAKYTVRDKKKPDFFNILQPKVIIKQIHYAMTEIFGKEFKMLNTLLGNGNVKGLFSGIN